MRIKAGKALKQGGRAARRAYRKVEAKVLAFEGRRSLRARARTARRIAKDAVVAGTLVAAVAALEAALHEVGRRHRTA